MKRTFLVVWVGVVAAVGVLLVGVVLGLLVFLLRPPASSASLRYGAKSGSEASASRGHSVVHSACASLPRELQAC
eukprot:8043424-Pyramimonas_sp.AAC.1